MKKINLAAKSKNKTVKDEFNKRSFRHILGSILLKEIPCFLLTFGGASMGLAFLNHNPVVELAVALSISFGSEYVVENHLFKNSPCGKTSKSSKKILGLTPRSFLFALGFGISTWALHGALLHDDHDHDHGKEQIKIPHPVHDHYHHDHHGHHHHEHASLEKVKRQFKLV